MLHTKDTLHDHGNVIIDGPQSFEVKFRFDVCNQPIARNVRQ